jgi:formylglycine-generating enzyme required for sulfatase activity
VLILAFVCTLGFTAYQSYQIAQQKARIAHLNAGTLHVRNRPGAIMTLTCIRHYHPERECLEGTIPFTTKSIALPGPADYVLTAHKADWTVSYPVYIDGLSHQIAIDIEPPPERHVPNMAYIPSGVFRMGDKDRHDVAGLANERPHHDVEMTDFWIDTHEVTNDQYRQCIEAGACAEPHYEDGSCYHPLPGEQVPGVFRQGSHPAVCVDWRQAAAYCRYAGKRLPTEAEWEKAAVGPQGYMWAFGNVFDAARANTSESGHHATTPVGRYAPNGYGLYDMSGNAMEWVADVYDGTFYHTLEAAQKNAVNRRDGGGRRIQRSGSWWHGIEGVRTSRRHFDRPNEASSLTGFRCARSLDADTRP